MLELKDNYLFLLLKTELEEALAQQTSKYDELNKKKLALESKVSELQEKNLRLSKEYSVLDENFAKANEKIKILEHSIKSMECANDSLQTSVRILEVPIFVFDNYNIKYKVTSILQGNEGGFAIKACKVRRRGGVSSNGYIRIKKFIERNGRKTC